MVASALKILYEYSKTNLANALEYRLDFLIQIISMAFNDFIWLFMWWVIFNRFQNIGSWGMKEMILIYCVGALSYGISGVFFGNRQYIAEIISSGKFDFYLSTPISSLFHALISRTSVFALGDILFGILLAAYALTIQQVPLLILLVTLSSIITIFFGVLVSSLAFYVGSAEMFSRKLFDSLITFSMYPLPAFQGIARFIVFFIIPGAMVGGVPVEIIQRYDSQLLLLMIGFTIVLVTVSLYVFNKGVRKYESGNLMHIRD